MSEVNGVLVLSAPSKSFSLSLYQDKVKGPAGSKIAERSERENALAAFRNVLESAKAGDPSAAREAPTSESVLQTHHAEVRGKQQKRKAIGGGFKPQNNLHAGGRASDSATPKPLQLKPKASSFYRSNDGGASLFGSKVSGSAKLFDDMLRDEAPSAASAANAPASSSYSGARFADQAL